MTEVKTGNELISTVEACGGKALVCFRKNACPGCMKVSKLIPLLEDETHPVIFFDCSKGYEESEPFGVTGTPVWVWFEDGRQTASVKPAGDEDILWDFVTETMGIDMLRPIFEVALEQGKAYAKQMQNVIIELMFRSKDDGDGIVSAAVYMICKACIEADADELDKCIDEQTAACIKRLTESMEAPGGDTEARHEAVEHLQAAGAEIREKIKKGLSH